MVMWTSKWAFFPNICSKKFKSLTKQIFIHCFPENERGDIANRENTLYALKKFTEWKSILGKWLLEVVIPQVYMAVCIIYFLY